MAVCPSCQLPMTEKQASTGNCPYCSAELSAETKTDAELKSNQGQAAQPQSESTENTSVSSRQTVAMDSPFLSSPESEPLNNPPEDPHTSETFVSPKLQIQDKHAQTIVLHDSNDDSSDPPADQDPEPVDQAIKSTLVNEPANSDTHDDISSKKKTVADFDLEAEKETVETSGSTGNKGKAHLQTIVDDGHSEDSFQLIRRKLQKETSSQDEIASKEDLTPNLDPPSPSTPPAGNAQTIVAEQSEGSFELIRSKLKKEIKSQDEIASKEDLTPNLDPPSPSTPPAGNAQTIVAEQSEGSFELIRSKLKKEIKSQDEIASKEDLTPNLDPPSPSTPPAGNAQTIVAEQSEGSFELIRSKLKKDIALGKQDRPKDSDAQPEKENKGPGEVIGDKEFVDPSVQTIVGELPPENSTGPAIMEDFPDKNFDQGETLIVSEKNPLPANDKDSDNSQKTVMLVDENMNPNAEDLNAPTEQVLNPSQKTVADFSKNEATASTLPNIGMVPQSPPPAPVDNTSQTISCTIKGGTVNFSKLKTFSDAEDDPFSAGAFRDNQDSGTFSGTLPGNMEDRVSGIWSTMGNDTTPNLLGDDEKTENYIPKEKTASQVIVKKRQVTSQDETGKFLSASQIAGDTSPDYELINELGQGGMGVVYNARQTSVDRTIALKMLKPDATRNDSMRNKFIFEASVTGELDHPNIVPIHDLGSTPDGALFYAMKKVKGTPWCDVLEERSLTENVETFMRTCDGMAFAHSKGIIHRDLKPENVMIGDFGEVLVMDWGLALQIDSLSSGKIEMAGTPAYMPPEMAAGPPEAINICSDIYLLGAILYEISTGLLPHTGETVMDCLMNAGSNNIQAYDPTDPKFRSGMRKELAEIALKAMSTEIEDRYASVTELQDAIREYQSHSESSNLTTRADEDFERAKTTNDYNDFALALFGYNEAVSLWSENEEARKGVEFCQFAYAECAYNKEDYDLALSLLDEQTVSHQRLIEEVKLAQEESLAHKNRVKRLTKVVRVMAVAVFLVLVGSVGVVSNSYYKQLTLSDNLKVAVNEANTQKEAAVAAKNEAEKQKSFAEEQKVKADKSATEAKESAIAAMISAEKEKDAKEDAIKAQKETEKALAAAELAKMKATEAKNEAIEAQGIAEEQRGKAIAAGEEVARQAYQAFISLADGKIQENQPQEARFLLDSTEEKSRDWEWRREYFLTELYQSELDLKQGPVSQVRWSKSGKLAFIANQDGFSLYQITTPKESEDPIQSVEIAKILAGDHVQSFDLIESDDSSKLQVVLNVPKLKRSLQLWDIAINTKADGTIEAKPTQSATQFKDPSSDGSYRVVKVSPDRSHMIAGGADQNLHIWDMNTGEILQSFPDHLDPVNDICFSPDGSFFVSASEDKTAILWRSRTEPKAVATSTVPSLAGFNYERVTTFRGHTGAIFTVDISPDSKYVVTGGEDHLALVWDVNSEVDFDNYKKLLLANKTRELDDKVTNLARRIYLEGHQDAIRSARFSGSADQLKVITAGNDNTIRLWQVLDGNRLQTVSGEEYLPKDGIVVKQAKENDHIRINGIHLETYRGHGSTVLSVAARSDEKYILSGSLDETVKIWTPADYIDGKRVIQSTTGEILSSALSTSKGWVASSSSNSNTVITNLKTGEQIASLQEGHSYLVTNLDITTDGRFALSVAGDNTARVWDLTSLAQTFLIENVERNSAGAITDNGKYICVAVKKDSHRAEIWDAQAQKLLHALDFLKEEITSIEFSPNQDLIALGDHRGNITIANTLSGEKVLHLHPHLGKIVSLQFSNDQKSLYSASHDTQVIALDITSGKVKNTMRMTDIKSKSSGIKPSVAKLHGNTLAVGCVDNTVRLIDLNAFKEIAAFVPHEDEDNKNKDKNSERRSKITSLDFTTNGKTLLISRSNNTSQLYSQLDGNKTWVRIGGDILDFSDSSNSPNEQKQLTRVWASRFIPGMNKILTGGGRDLRI